MAVLAYLLTFATYDTHLPGSEKGWVDAQHCIPGSPVLPPEPGRERYWRSRLNEAPWFLDHDGREIMLQVILKVCEHRRWIAHAVHIRTTHIHAVIGGDVKPERMLTDFKAYATRAFRSRFSGGPRKRYWTNHGSTRYLWKQESLNAAIDYVLRGQGVTMACYPREAEEGFVRGSLTLPGSDSR